MAQPAKAMVNENIYVFLFRCEKCKRPITTWVSAPLEGGETFERAKQKDFYLRCQTDCGWEGQIDGQHALGSWKACDSYEKDLA
jgi:hypothetical protein